MAARIARVPYQNFQAWAKANLIHGVSVKVGAKRETIYTYKDLLLIRLVVWLRNKGVKPTAIKTALKTIQMMSGGGKDAWMKASICVQDGAVVAIIPSEPDFNPVGASQGPQKMALVFFPELIEQLRAELVPRDQFSHIDVDPWVLGGTPRIKGTRIPTRAVALARESGQDPRFLYPQLSEEEVEEAADYEAFLEAA